MDKKIRVKDRNSSNYPYCYTLKVDGMGEMWEVVKDHD